MTRPALHDPVALPPSPLGLGQVRAGMLLPAVDLLRESGLDAGEVLARAGIDPDRLSRDPGGRLMLADIARALAEGQQATGYPHFGLLAGERIDPRVFGFTTRLMLDSSTVGEALQTFALRHHLVDAGAVVMQLPVTRGRAAFAYSVYTPVPQGLDALLDASAAIAMRVLSLLCGSAWRPLKVCLPHRAPKDLSEYRRVLGPNVTFNAEIMAIVFAAGWLDKRVARGAIHAADGVDGGAPEQRVELPLAHLVRRALRPMVFTGTATQPNAARMFSLHPRALSRRLRAQGTSFQSLLVETRMDVARQLLRDTDLSASDVAVVLHYGELSAFTKAFREHCGEPPTAWRARVRAGPRAVPGEGRSTGGEPAGRRVGTA